MLHVLPRVSPIFSCNSRAPRPYVMPSLKTAISRQCMTRVPAGPISSRAHYSASNAAMSGAEFTCFCPIIVTRAAVFFPKISMTMHTHSFSQRWREHTKNARVSARGSALLHCAMRQRAGAYGDTPQILGDAAPPGLSNCIETASVSGGSWAACSLLLVFFQRRVAFRRFL